MTLRHANCISLKWRCPKITCSSVVVYKGHELPYCLELMVLMRVCIFWNKACPHSWVGLTRPWERSKQYRTKLNTCLDISSDLFKFTTQPRLWHRANRVWVCFQQVFGHRAVSNQSSRYLWTLIPLDWAIIFTSFATIVNSNAAIAMPKWRALNW